MCRKFTYLISFVLVLTASAAVHADVLFSDDFETPHDFVADSVEGTGWDGFLGLDPGETVDALSASIDRTGELYLASTGAFYHDPWDPLGPFLYKIFEGDFVATVKVTDYAGTADAVVWHNSCGLLARADPDDAGPSEDWVAIDYFPIWGCGNYVRTADDGTRFENCHNGKQFDLDPYLQLERQGNVFYFRSSGDGSSWTEMNCSPITRDDLAGVPLQVGLYHVTFSDSPGYAAFDDFIVEIIIVRKAHDPDPADDADDVTIALLQWEAGEEAVWHDVYFGTDPDALEFMARQTLAQKAYYHSPGITAGATYYWRVDEVEADGATIQTGDVWSFTAIPLTAWNPSPPDGARCVFTDVDLSWSPGSTAVKHDVYFGTDQTQVANGSGGTLKGNQPGVTYEPGDLANDTTYYWRVDEVEGDSTTKYQGDVWSFKTMPDISIGDPDLIGWWKFDEGSGSNALDWSGHGNHGTLVGGPQWVGGYDGDALEFDGDDDLVDIPYSADMTPSAGATMSAWVFPMDTVRATIVGQFGAYGMAVLGGLQLKSVIWGNDWVLSDVTIETGEWSHVAMTWDVTNSHRQVFLNGELVGQQGGAMPIPEVTNNIGIGIFVGWPATWPHDAFAGVIDDVRVYNKVLTAAEIPETMRGDPFLAWNPKPVDGSTPDIEHATPLSWSPGDKAAKHDVYFGTDGEAVEDADTTTMGIYRGRRDPNNFTPGEALEFGQSYYWRIDEYNTDATISTGRIWSLTVADYLMVDNFESYDDYCNRIFYTWPDGWGHNGDVSCGVPAYGGNGTGSTVGYLREPYAEQTITHEGGQSMPLEYLNDSSTAKALYSETTRTFEPPQDWTRHDSKALTLWFRGHPAPVGSFSYDPVTDIYTMTAAGMDIWGTSDEFHYAYKRLSGVGTIEAQVLSLQNTDGWTKAGVMIRETLDPNSANAMMLVTPGNGASFQGRTVAGNESTYTNQTGITAPYWVRLERGSGNSFTGYHSTNGSVWEPLGSAITIGMPTDVYVGLALTSHNTGATCMAEFSKVTITGTVAGQWRSQDIGIASNVAEQLYVAVEDSATPIPNVAVVKHDDPDAVLSDTWQEWNIDLKQVSDAGVNLQSVKKIYIGVGDRNMPKLGGAGMLYIDDIRLYRLRCIPSLVQLAGDFSDNCAVDHLDLEIMADEWLGSGAELEADLDQDSDVDFGDYAILAEAWLAELLWP